MIFLLILLLLFYAAYVNQTTYINYFLAFCFLISIVSLIYTIISSTTIKIDAKLDKDVCYKYGTKKIFFTSSSFLHPTIYVKVILFNKQLHKKQGVYTVKVKTDGCTYLLPAEECGDIDVIINTYTLKGFLGIFRIRRKFYRRFNYKVYPKIKEFNKDDIKELLLSNDGEPINRKGEDYQEIYEIRPIRPGDNLRYVHPSLSAKFDQYMIKDGSKTLRKLILYEFNNIERFTQVTNELGKIRAIFNEVCKDNNNYFCVKFKYNWYIILNDRSLFGLFDLIYKEYIK